MSETTWAKYFETPIGKTPIQTFDPQMRRRKPDGILVRANPHNREGWQYFLLDYTRCSDHSKSGLATARNEKLRQYSDLLTHLQITNPLDDFTVIPLVTAFGGALDEEEWEDDLAKLSLPAARQVKCMQTAITATCEAFSMIYDVRTLALRTSCNSNPAQQGTV